MLNILSYIGVNLQSELCLWTLVGLIRTIFDATLFKVNANLKQVWQMSMPPELSMPVQRGFRTMISGVMLVQCFTVYLYLASYIVLLYPVFLEERPTLVLPWLLLAAIRKFLCELTSLALGLGACLLLGPARPQCIKFVIFKIASITPAFYMWMLVFSYYKALKVAAAFKRFPVMASSDHDYGLELAVRRRRTKSLQDEDQVRKKLVASLNYEETSASQSLNTPVTHRYKSDGPFRMAHSTYASDEEIKTEIEALAVNQTTPPDRALSNLGSYEDWCGSELTIPRDTDRILEQFVIMLLRIEAYKKIEGADPNKFVGSTRDLQPLNNTNLECTALNNEESETPPQVGNTNPKKASYLQDYPQIFMKKSLESQSVQLQTDIKYNMNQNTRTNNSKGIAINSSHAHFTENQNTNIDQTIQNILENVNENNPSLYTNSTDCNVSLKKNSQEQMTSSELQIMTQKRSENHNALSGKNSIHIESDNIIQNKDINQNDKPKIDTSERLSATEFDVTLNRQRSEVERNIKEVSVESYQSLNDTIYMKSNKQNADSIKPERSKSDSYNEASTSHKKKQDLTAQQVSSQKDEIRNNSDLPTSTRTLAIIHPRQSIGTMTDLEIKSSTVVNKDNQDKTKEKQNKSDFK